MKEIKIVSLFSGVGGLDYGFHKYPQAKFVFANDINEFACYTYHSYFGFKPMCADIEHVDINMIPECDLVIAGSPNNGFSVENQINNSVNHPSNKLVAKFVEIVKIKNPNVFIFENVPEIMTVGGGKYARFITESLSDYHIEIYEVNALNYSVPQKRTSVLFVGSKIGRIERPVQDTVTYTVRDAFEGIHSGIPNQSDVNPHRKITLERMSYVPAGGNINDIPEELRPKGNHSDRYRRLEYDKPSITIANPRKAVILHPLHDRILTVRECARIQSFPDDFLFYGSLDERQQFVANAFPPRLSVKIADVVMKAFNEKLD